MLSVLIDIQSTLFKSSYLAFPSFEDSNQNRCMCKYQREMTTTTKSTNKWARIKTYTSSQATKTIWQKLDLITFVYCTIFDQNWIWNSTNICDVPCIPNAEAIGFAITSSQKRRCDSGWGTREVCGDVERFKNLYTRNRRWTSDLECHHGAKNNENNAIHSENGSFLFLFLLLGCGRGGGGGVPLSNFLRKRTRERSE